MHEDVREDEERLSECRQARRRELSTKCMAPIPRLTRRRKRRPGEFVPGPPRIAELVSGVAVGLLRAPACCQRVRVAVVPAYLRDDPDARDLTDRPDHRAVEGVHAASWGPGCDPWTRHGVQLLGRTKCGVRSSFPPTQFVVEAGPDGPPTATAGQVCQVPSRDGGLPQGGSLRVPQTRNS